MLQFKYLLLLFSTCSLCAFTTYQVTVDSDEMPGGIGDPGDLRHCINTMNIDLRTIIDDVKITFAHPMTIQLNGLLPIINNSGNPVNISIGNSGSIPIVTIDGNLGSYGGLFIAAGDVTIQNMIFQNMTAKGGDGGDGISGGGGGMGAGGAIYVAESFLGATNPSLTLMNVTINNCSAQGGNGGNYISGTGEEGGGGGGGFFGNGGSITTIGITGGGGGGGFGGNGGAVTQATSLDPHDGGGGGGGGGGFGSLATTGTPIENLGNGGSDVSDGFDGNGYGLLGNSGDGAGSFAGSIRGGGGGGGGAKTIADSSGGGGGGGNSGLSGTIALATAPPGGGNGSASGGIGSDGAGGAGGGVVFSGDSANSIDGSGGSGGYAGGGGGGSGVGYHDADYKVQGGLGGMGGGGGGGGVDQSGTTNADGGNSSGGGGGGGGGPSNTGTALGGTDIGQLDGGAGGNGASNYGAGFGGGGGGGGSGLGGAIFVDRGVILKIQAFSETPTIFKTISTNVYAGSPGIGGDGSTPAYAGAAAGPSIFLRQGSALELLANDEGDILTLESGVQFTDDTDYGGIGTNILVSGKGTVIYNGSTTYKGSITVNNANFKVNGVINNTRALSVCRNTTIGSQRGTLSGIGRITGPVAVNSGIIAPDANSTLTLGNLTLNSATPPTTLGSLVHIEINADGTSLVAVNGVAHLAGILEFDIASDAHSGAYTILTSSAIVGDFDQITFTQETPVYTLSLLPIGSPTYIQFELFNNNPAYPTLRTQNLWGNELKMATYLNAIAPLASSLGLTDQLNLLNTLSFPQYQNALETITPTRNSIPTFAAQNMMFLLSESLNSHFTKKRLTHNHNKNRHTQKTAFIADSDFLAAHKLGYHKSNHETVYTPSQTPQSEFWTMGFGQFSRQKSQNQTPGFNFNNGGFFAAYDYGNNDQGYVGLLAGYAYSAIHEQQSMGSGHINAGYLSLYAMRYFANFFIDAAIWGEYMKVNQKRIISYPGFRAIANSSYHAEQLDLHIGVGYDFNIRTFTLEPFSVLDWVTERDPNYTETGANPYNMNIYSKNSWMLRSESGLNGYKTTTYEWGAIIVQAKLSYVYKKPSHVGSINGAIVNAPPSFVVETFTSGQNLISPAAELFFQTHWNGYASVTYNGEFGSGYISNQFNIEIGYSF